MIDVQVLLYDGLDELDAVAPLEVLRAAGLATRTVTIDGAAPTVRGGHGLVLGVDGPLEARPGLLIVPGGGWAVGPTGAARVAVAEGRIPAAITRCHMAGATIAAVCTGGMLLAAAGLLAGRPAVTHRVALDDLAAAGADVRPDARVIDDGDILTAGGVTSGIDLALHLVERFVGVDAAARGALRLEHERRGPVLTTALPRPA